MKIKLTLCGLFIVLVASLAFAGDQFAGILFKPLFAERKEIPEYLLYEAVFRIEFKHKAKRETADASTYLKQTLDLDADQHQTLQQIADEFVEAMQPLEDRARAIREDFKTQIPAEGFSKDQPLPEPPKEIAELQARREAVVQEHRDKLLLAFGSEKFKTVDGKVKTEFAARFNRIDGELPARGQK